MNKLKTHMIENLNIEHFVLSGILERHPETEIDLERSSKVMFPSDQKSCCFQNTYLKETFYNVESPSVMFVGFCSPHLTSSISIYLSIYLTSSISIATKKKDRKTYHHFSTIVYFPIFLGLTKNRQIPPQKSDASIRWMIPCSLESGWP